MYFMSEIIVPRDNFNYEEVLDKAAKLTDFQTDRVAERAGFNQWLNLVNPFEIRMIDRKVSEVLRMPYPSETTQLFRVKAGFPDGVQTEENSHWSMAIAEDWSRNKYSDLGVRLVCCKQVQGDKNYSIRFPLDLVVDYFYYSMNPQRPDRIMVNVGDRQLPYGSNFSSEVAQHLIGVGKRFIEIIASGEAANLPSSSPILSKQQSIRRLFGNKSRDNN